MKIGTSSSTMPTCREWCACAIPVSMSIGPTAALTHRFLGGAACTIFMQAPSTTGLTGLSAAKTVRCRDPFGGPPPRFFWGLFDVRQGFDATRLGGLKRSLVRFPRKGFDCEGKGLRRPRLALRSPSHRGGDLRGSPTHDRASDEVVGEAGKSQQDRLEVQHGHAARESGIFRRPSPGAGR